MGSLRFPFFSLPGDRITTTYCVVSTYMCICSHLFAHFAVNGYSAQSFKSASNSRKNLDPTRATRHRPTRKQFPPGRPAWGTRDLDHGHDVRLFHGRYNHTRAIEILDYTHDTRVCRPAGRVWSSEAARSGWACHRDPARRRTISHYVALRPDRNLSRDGSQWLTMARCAGRRTCDILRVGSLWFASGCFASSRVPGTPGGYVSGYCVAVPLSRRGTASRPVGIDRRGPAAVLKSIEVGVTL